MYTIHKLHSQNWKRAFSLASEYVKKRPPDLELVVESGPTAFENTNLVGFYTDSLMRDDPVVGAVEGERAGLAELVRNRLRAQVSLVVRRRGGANAAPVAAASGGPVNYNSEMDLNGYAGHVLKESSCQRLAHFWSAVSKEANLLDTLHLPQIWEVVYVSTAPEWRRVGLARFLLEQQRRLVAKQGISAMGVHCTSAPLANTLIRSGFSELSSARPASSFRDPQGRSWVEVDTPVRTFYRSVARERTTK